MPRSVLKRVGIYFEVDAGAWFALVVEEALQLARETHQSVYFHFNDRLCEVHPHSLPDDVFYQIDQESKR